MDEIRLAFVTAVWTLWCVQHSLLNSRGVLDRFAAPGTRIGRYYRLFYNLVSVGTLAAVVRLTHYSGEPWILTWDGWLRPLQVTLFVIATAAFALTFRCHDFLEFLGLRPFVEKGRGERPVKPLAVDGIYGIVRHPQYTAGLIMLWARDVTAGDIAVNIVLSIYLIVGARMEDSRLSAGMGEEFDRYRKAVPAFFPTRIPRISDLAGSE
jgi:protein-S-isoprenylcysteine O-methyltransferase Ste14